MFIIGVDPHKASHTAAVLDRDEQLVGEVRVRADRSQRDRLLEFAAPFQPRTWAIEGATGTGALLAQQLVAVGEAVVDVPPKLSARVRLLATERSDKTDAFDARSAAVVALRHRSLRPVAAEDHAAVLRVLAKRHHDLAAQRTRVVCRLHAVLCQLVEGGLTRDLTANKAAAVLRRIRAGTAVAAERRRLAVELLSELRRVDTELTSLRHRTRDAVAASSTTVTEIFGVGPTMAAYLIGYSGDIRRFPTAGHYARYNGTAPIEASSGERIRHRLNPRGNRQLNHALHIAAVTQIRNKTPGRAYYDHKLAEGKTRKEALRALKRRISDAAYRQLLADTTR
ncbi:MAG TPA: IS110 family transposase [Acidimicrobiales bacterium]|nr:IS110 family transposase [Acidimicrobiales bacterium]